jgi:hypothetical protein
MHRDPIIVVGADAGALAALPSDSSGASRQSLERLTPKRPNGLLATYRNRSHEAVPMTTADRILFGSAEKHSSQQSELAAGGTAIGTGFNTPPQFSPRSQRRLPS